MTPITYTVNLSQKDLTKKNRAGQLHYDLFLKLAEEAENTSDKLSNNYKDISNKWKNYECFTVVFAPISPFTFNPSYEAVAFSALQTDHFGKKTGRALTKTYYAKSVRQENLLPRKLPNLASRYMLPSQYDYATKNNFNHLFISFQSTLMRKNFSKLFVSMLNKEYSEYINPFPWKSNTWKQLNGLYYTCKMDGIIDDNCWQYIILHSFNDTQFSLHRKTYD